MTDKLIAILDDEQHIVSLVSEYLRKKGFRARGFTKASEFFEYLTEEKPDLIILDLMMPRMDGFEVCEKLKSNDRYSQIPVIILSGKADSNDKVSCLDLGADDYVVKPFETNELEARVRAVLRRVCGQNVNSQMTVGDILKIDLQKHEVTVEADTINLTPAEFSILELLSSKKGHVFSRERILDYLWGDEKIVVSRTVDVHVTHLREKLGKAGRFIENIRGIGYKINEEK
ncbi:MAG: response regulator transcription factor [Candidatus Omnitrophota bacterium]